MVVVATAVEKTVAVAIEEVRAGAAARVATTRAEEATEVAARGMARAEVAHTRLEVVVHGDSS